MAFSNVISEHDPKVQTIANELRETVLSADNRIKEKFFGENSEKAYYLIGDDSNVFAAIHPIDDRCRLYLHDIDKVNYDNFEVTGAGDEQMPYIIFKSKEDIHRDELQNLVKKVVNVAV